MNQLKTNMFLFTQLIVLLFITACDDEPVENTDNPANLVVKVNVLQDESGTVEITATADYATEYRFYLNENDEALEKNVTGLFSYTFDKSGTYSMTVRAYGNSGRYISRDKQITILIGSDQVEPSDGYSTPLNYNEYNLVWNDEFEGNTLNENDWTFEIGDGCPNCGWGNNELQYYRKENTSLSNGILTIEAKKQAFQGKAYTSSRIITKGKQEFTYGRVDIRALLPEGQGIWPALWMLGGNISKVSWPACGEIDIMEMVGGTNSDNVVHGTVHYEKDDSHVYQGDDHQLSGKKFSDEYHVFSLIWNENFIAWYVNDKEFYRFGITADYLTEFHEPFFFILNVAVGGNWPGAPDGTTIFPQQMKVDYIRVFKSH